MLKLCFAGLVAVLCLSIASSALADDWLMFRKDAGRAATSSDKVELPLKLAWNWKGEALGGASSMSTCVVRRGNVFFVAVRKPDKPLAKGAPSTQRTLICAEAESGKIVWTRELHGVRMNEHLPEDIGPAVTASGIVYVLDDQTVGECSDAYVIKAFTAEKGKLIGTIAVPIRELLTRYFLREDHQDEKKHRTESDFALTPTQKPDC
jgi:hypothetical protein